MTSQEMERGRTLDSLRRNFDEARRGLKKANRQIDILREKNSVLHEFVTLDSDTGIANLRSFRETFDREWKRSLRDSSDLGLILCEIDQFSKYRKKYGKAIAANCLTKVVKTVANTLNRPADFLARFKEDMLAVILPGTDREGVEKIAQLLRKRLEEKSIAHRDSTMGVVTMSVGAGTRLTTKDGRESPESFFHEVNMIRFQALQKGGNCCEVA